jgi:hypothetical protein
LTRSCPTSDSDLAWHRCSTKIDDVFTANHHPMVKYLGHGMVQQQYYSPHRVCTHESISISFLCFRLSVCC